MKIRSALILVFTLGFGGSFSSLASIQVPPNHILDFQCQGSMNPNEGIAISTLPVSNFIHFVHTVQGAPPVEWDIEITQVQQPNPDSVQMMGAHLGTNGLPDAQYRVTVNGNGSGLIEKRDQSGYNELNVTCQSTLGAAPLF
jgi:hypothetical protein